MIWIWAITGLALSAAVFLLTRPLRMPREPDREGTQEGDASAAYDRMGRSPVFAFGRYLVLRPLAGYHPKGAVFDVGCGPGYLAAAIARKFGGLDVVGLDISTEMISIARRDWPAQSHRNLGFITGDVVSFPVREATVDTVVSSLSLHHWTEAEAAIKEIFRVLKPGGRLLLFDLRRDSPRFVYYAFLLGQVLFTPAAIRRTNGAVGSLWSSYTTAEMKALLSKAPFRMTRVNSRPGWLLARAVK
jgi:ubiquinone/menaquinone biosynthesis C-methylase UbiE